MAIWSTLVLPTNIKGAVPGAMWASTSWCYDNNFLPSISLHKVTRFYFRQCFIGLYVNSKACSSMLGCTLGQLVGSQLT